MFEENYEQDSFGIDFAMGGGWGGGGFGFGDFNFGGGDPFGFSPVGLPMPDSGGGGGGWNIPPITIAFPGGNGGGGGAAPSLSRTLTQIVDDYERQLQANLASWQNGGKSAADAISVGWSLMNAMVTACARYGAQGQRSAAERDRRINPALLRWDWIGYYIDPITGGPSTLPPLPAEVGLTPSGGIAGISNSTLLLILAAVALVLLSRK